MLTVTELEYVSEAVLTPDSETLGVWLTLKVDVMVPDTQLDGDKLAYSEPDAVPDSNAVELTDSLPVRVTLGDPELQYELMVDALGAVEKEGERVDNSVKVTDTVGVLATLVLTLGEVVPVRQRVGEADWMEEVREEKVKLPDGDPEGGVYCVLGIGDSLCVTLTVTDPVGVS